MERLIKKTTLILALVSVTAVVFADRGSGKRSKARTTLNITASSASLKNSILANIKNGIAYKGSFLTTNRQANTTVNISSNTLMTYQKGNTTYIIPYKNRVVMSSNDMKQGYTGVKFVIRSKN